MASRKIRRGGNAIVSTTLIIGILVLVNVVAAHKFGRIDLTEDGLFTISDASRRLVAGLPDRLTAKAFISGDLPVQVRGIGRYLRDVLAEFAAASQGKMSWEVVDPASDEKLKLEARRLKVHQARLSVWEKTKASVSESFLGVAFQFGGRVESIPFVKDVANLEYEISSTIRRLSSRPRKIGFSTGHGEPSLLQGLSRAREALKRYEVVAVDLSEGKKPVPADIDVLLMVGPTQQLAERAKYELDQYLMTGRPLALLLDGMVLETPRGQVPPDMPPPRIGRGNGLGLAEQLEHYGVKLHEDLVMDRQNARVMLPAGREQRVITNYPGFPIVTDLSRDHAVTRGLRSFVPVFPSSVELTGGVGDGKDGARGQVLAKSSSGSWRHTGFFFFDPMRPPQPSQQAGPFGLAVYLEGALPSFFAGRPVPEPGPAAPPQEKAKSPSSEGKRSPDGTRLVVVGDSDFVKDEFVAVFRDNLVLFENLIDFLAEDAALIAIRSKSQTRRHLREVPDSKVTLARYGNIVGLPLGFIVLGLLRWRWRRRQRQRRARELVEQVGRSAAERRERT